MLDMLFRRPEKKNFTERRLLVVQGTDRPLKSLLKSISWRLVGTLDTIFISYIITGKVTAAVSIGSIEVLSKTVLYYFHERVWAHIRRIRLSFFRRANGKRFEIKRIGQYSKGKNTRRIA